MRRSPLCALALSVVTMALTLNPAADAATAAKTNAKPPVKTAGKTAAKPAGKAAARAGSKTKQARRAVPKKAAPVVAAATAPAAEAELNPAQAELASRVLLGDAACEFGQTIHIAAIAQQPGLFRATLGKTSYTLVPQATTSGAVRLEDAKAGVVWLQIPTKSMLLDARINQRLVDDCKTEVQRSAVVDPANRLGIAPDDDEQPGQAAAAVAVAPPAAVPVAAVAAVVDVPPAASPAVLSDQPAAAPPATAEPAASTAPLPAAASASVPLAEPQRGS